MYDIIIKNGFVVDWEQNIEGIKDIGIKDGKIAEINDKIEEYKGNQLIDVSGKLVIPGIIDTHVHIIRNDSKSAGYRMLIKAGITAAVDMKGPAYRANEEIGKYAYGLKVAVLQGLVPGKDLNKNERDRKVIKKKIEEILSQGAFGIKVVGGHYPFTPETTKLIIEETYNQKAYFAFHVGTTNSGSNIDGVKEAVELIGELPGHIAHVNSYCRGLVMDELDEAIEAVNLLKKSPNISSESYLAKINGTSGKFNEEGKPESLVTRNCLRGFGYSEDEEGIRNSIMDKNAAVYIRVGEEMKLIWGKKAYDLWKEYKSDVYMCFPVNSPKAIFLCATEKRDDGEFVVDSISTDGGSIPRNFIIKNGLPLVKFGGLNLKEFVKKTSYNPAKVLGLKNKGSLRIGKDADVTIIDKGKNKATHTIIDGKISMIDGFLINSPGKVITQSPGVKHLEKIGVDYIEVDLEDSYYWKRALK